MSRTPPQRYPGDGRRRLALPPAVLAVIALLAGLALVGSGGFVVILYAVAILALICGWFAIQARQWWWLPLLAAVAVLWNPVLPFGFRGTWWTLAQYAASVLFLLVGALVRVRVEAPGGERTRTARDR